MRERATASSWGGRAIESAKGVKGEENGPTGLKRNGPLIEEAHDGMARPGSGEGGASEGAKGLRGAENGRATLKRTGPLMRMRTTAS
jgi:hypothetical protein